MQKLLYETIEPHHISHYYINIIHLLQRYITKIDRLYRGNAGIMCMLLVLYIVHVNNID